MTIDLSILTQSDIASAYAAGYMSVLGSWCAGYVVSVLVKSINMIK